MTRRSRTRPEWSTGTDQPSLAEVSDEIADFWVQMLVGAGILEAEELAVPAREQDPGLGGPGSALGREADGRRLGRIH